MKAHLSISNAMQAGFYRAKVQHFVAHCEKGRPNEQECNILGVVGSNVLRHVESAMPLRGGISKIQACFKI